MSHRALGAALLLLAACTRAEVSDRLITPEPAPEASGPRAYARPTPACDAPAPAPAPAQLLTRFEYDNTIRDLLFDDSRPASTFPVENKVLGFDNNAHAHVANPTLVDRYQSASEVLAYRAVSERRALLLPCDPALVGESTCGEEFVGHFGRRAFRRPIDMEERAIFLSLFNATHAQDGFDVAIELVVRAMLQSPQFLYRTESVQTSESTDAPRPLDPFGLASRLSYFLWGSMPDAELLDAADSDMLATFEAVEAQARRLLADPRATAAALQFFRQWLGLEALDGLNKDTSLFPGGAAQYRPMWRASLESFLAHAFARRGDAMSALLTEPLVFADATMAAVYGLDGPIAEAYEPVAMDPRSYAGLLTQPALMAMLSYPDQSSPIHRGIFVRQKLLCEALPPPPADVMVEAPDPAPGSTTRERFAQHTESPTCFACHVRIDPVGFGFEAFDELGRYRTFENGLPIDTRGDLVMVRDGLIAGPFTGVTELAQRLAGSLQVRDCVAAQWYRYAIGRNEVDADRCGLDVVYRAFDDSGGDFVELLVAIATSVPFRFRAGIVLVADDGPTWDDAQAPAPSPSPPQGALESVDAGVARGWAADADFPIQPLTIELFLDGTRDTGIFVAASIADELRPDVNLATGMDGHHGFAISLPAAARDGVPHTLTAYAVDATDGRRLPLDNAPMSFTVTP